MIHVFVGTKAQFIKMAPIMQELDRRSIPYNFIDAGQHAGITGDLIEQFGLRQPDVQLRDSDKSITTVMQAILWTGKSVLNIVFRPGWIRRALFCGQGGICLIHGDTLTTLLSLFYAKRSGVKVAHVEAGLRSFHLFDPFPEEIIRLLAMRFSDRLFAPSDWAYDNLVQMGYESKSVRSGGNTIVDTLRFVQSQSLVGDRPAVPYVVVTTHRVETIYSASRLTMLVSLIERVAQERQVLFVLHEPTQKQLERHGLLGRLDGTPGVKLLPLQPYLTFVNLLAGADFVITDGGSIQEETHVLDVPCLIFRANTERNDGLGTNAQLAGFDRTEIDNFLQRLPTKRRPTDDSNGQRPSAQLVGYLLEYNAHYSVNGRSIPMHD